MNRSAKLVSSLLNNPATVVGLRSNPQTGLTFVRNAGAGPAPAHQLPPFPPGPRQFEQMKNWVGSAGVFGATAFTLLCYFSDWRVVVDWIPFYSGKFQAVDEEKK